MDITTSPACKIFVFPCENCFGLVRDKGLDHGSQVNVNHCEYCGFGNVLDMPVRKRFGKECSLSPVPYPVVVRYYYYWIC